MGHETKFIVEDIIKRKDIDAIDKILEREDFELIKYLAREIVLSDNIPSNIILEQYIDKNTGEFIDKNLNKSEDFYEEDGTAKDDTSFKKKTHLIALFQHIFQYIRPSINYKKFIEIITTEASFNQFVRALDIPPVPNEDVKFNSGKFSRYSVFYAIIGSKYYYENLIDNVEKAILIEEEKEKAREIKLKRPAGMTPLKKYREILNKQIQYLDTLLKTLLQYNQALLQYDTQYKGSRDILTEIEFIIRQEEEELYKTGRIIPSTFNDHKEFPHLKYHP